MGGHMLVIKRLKELIKVHSLQVTPAGVEDSQPTWYMRIYPLPPVSPVLQSHAYIVKRLHAFTPDK
ncbi:hypothetical protein K437DRAFT_259163 [Tilletiaria anomala UBC 951]|uniref:Uncharacterized protein n=1 Tax=Tilletiaria anomala (strain ATCC 24038 / CBS 436.72 / UBC 951) TaxID=1037660 RepID=A0A066VK70_TILAU|nr:uncharacterized protein K437DRAFT_259163 [Tilletiaria anomala UBC 951]KDN39159.1 hypothetical protein K437DRAFT_259163 [Tilletiaria anomala UBC 951]